MRTIETTVYNFNELSDEAKEKVIEKLYDLNVDYNWWQWTYEDAKQIGLLISEFDLNRSSFVKGKLDEPLYKCLDSILANHGETCETYKTALRFKKELSELDENSEDFDNLINDLEDEFLNDICEDYRIILQNEYEYLTSEPAIIETILANAYEFDEFGNLV